MSAAQIKQNYGTAFSGNERQIGDQWLPNEKDNAQQAEVKLKRLREKIAKEAYASQLKTIVGESAPASVPAAAAPAAGGFKIVP